MAPRTINVLVSTFPGLDLPSTLSVPVDSSARISDFADTLSTRIPHLDQLIITTNSNRQVLPHSSQPLASLLSSESDDLLPLRLTTRLCGGKGGFGSMLRATGGKMSSKRNRNQGEQNGSSRNLEGRRIRTVNEAKALAEYLAVKPGMDKKEKEERKKRWESIVEEAERREQEIKDGTGPGGQKTRLDGKWVEAKEEAGEKAREAILKALQAGDVGMVHGLKESDESASASAEDESSGEDEIPATKTNAKAQPKAIWGWDDDDESMSEDEEDEEQEAPPAQPEVVDKGKGKA
ncbi:hypothetical protein K402DRAFT_391174 [Aulographum hederae CBS 113979]|uniref:Uncharacterized protein n=1 Tax=Aulographum hederae CBS 113979 TaxID=1176131 RepID=A0A6G1H7S7_9PEZI|nr:hypothetical protein K402DRAFT_391174 [Aulographum hederae CBS 113979]